MRVLFVLFIGSALFAASCGSSLVINSDKDSAVDFSQYKTFGFLPWDQSSGQAINDLNRRRLESAVTAELEKRGMKRAAEGYGDIVFAFHLTITEETGYTSYTNTYGGMGYGYGGFGYGYYGGGGMTTTTTQPYTYTTGNLIIDGFDVAKKQLVWEVVASDDVSGDISATDEIIKVLINKMFVKYPIAAPEASN